MEIIHLEPAGVQGKGRAGAGVVRCGNPSLTAPWRPTGSRRWSGPGKPPRKTTPKSLFEILGDPPEGAPS